LFFFFFLAEEEFIYVGLCNSVTPKQKGERAGVGL